MRRAVVVVCVLALTACGGTPASTSTSATTATSAATSAASAAPAATTATPVAGATNGITASDVPSGYTKCSQSGDVSRATDKYTPGEWQYQQKQGMASGDAEIFADSAAGCEGLPEVGSGTGKVIASLVAKFKDEASAKAAYAGGVFGVNATELAKNAAATSGSASGFGATSLYLFTPKSAAAIWLSSTTVVFVEGQNAAEADFKKAATALKGRTG